MRKWSGADNEIKSKDQVIAELKAEIDQNNKKINEIKMIIMLAIERYKVNIKLKIYSILIINKGIKIINAKLVKKRYIENPAVCFLFNIFIE